MATKIRGITIELSADASGVLDAVKEVNTEISSTSRQLSDVNKLLKLDPTNTELLSQKTSLLKEQIGNTEEKLASLKTAQETMDANGVDKNSEQYQALEREIIATEQELAKLKGTAGSGSAALATISAKTGEWSEKLETAGKKMSIVSAGIVAFGTAAVAAFNEVDAGADIVIKKTGATGEEAEALEQSYKNVAKGIVADFEDIGSAVGEVSTKFGLTGEDLENLSEKFLKFAEINDMDVTTSVDSVAKALAAFGLSGDYAEELMDRLTVVGQQTGISVDDLTNGLVNNAAAFQELGLNIDQAAVLMGQIETSGVSYEAVMTGLSKALKNATEEGVPLDEALANLQDTILNGTGEVDGLTAAYDLFGKSGALIYEAVKNGTLDFANLATTLGDVSGAVDSTYESTLDGTDAMALAWQNVQLAMAELGEAIGTTLAPIMTSVTSAIQSVTEWFSNLDEGTKSTIVTIGLVVAAIGPLLLIGSKVLSAISSITGALSAMGSSTFGPIGLVVAGVAALVSGMLLLKDRLSSAYLAASPFTEALNAIAEANSELSTAISNTKKAYEDSTTASEAEAYAAGVMYDTLTNLISAYDGSAESAAAIQAVVDSLNATVPNLGLAWDSNTNSLNLNTNEIYNQITAMKAQAQVAALQSYYTDSLKEQYQAQKNVSDAYTTLNQVLEAHGLTMEDLNAITRNGQITADDLEMALFDEGESFWNLGDAATEVMNAITNYNNAADNAPTCSENVAYAEEQLGIAMAAAAQAAHNSTESIKERYQQTFGTDVPEALNTALVAAEDAGMKIPQNLVDGIMDGSISVEDAVTQITELLDQKEAAETAAQNTAVGYSSKLKKGGKDAKNAGASLCSNAIDGMLSKKKLVESTGEDIASSANTGLDSKTSTAKDIGSNYSTNFHSGISDKLSQVKLSAQTVGSGAYDGLDSKTTSTKTVGSNMSSNLKDGIVSMLERVKAAAKDTSKSVYDAFNGHTSDVLTVGANYGKNLYTGIASYTTQIVSLARKVANDTYTSINNYAASMTTVGQSWGLNLRNGFSSSAYSIGGTAGNIANSAYSAVKGYDDWFYWAGQCLIEGLNSGMRSMASAVYSTASNIANTAASVVARALKISSPSRVMMEIGEYTGEGLALGIENSASEVYAAMNAITDEISNADPVMNVGVNALNSNQQTEAAQTQNMVEALNVEIGNVENLLNQYLPFLAEKTDIVLDDGTLAGRMAPAINDELQRLSVRAARG